MQISKLIKPQIRLKTLHHETLPSKNTYELHTHYMSQFAECSINNKLHIIK